MDKSLYYGLCGAAAHGPCGPAAWWSCPPPPGGTARWVRTAAVRQHLDLTSFRTAVRHLRLPSSMCLAG
jgi:hypothetical protein